LDTTRRPDIEVISFDMDGTLTGGRFIELVWGEGIPRLFSEARNIPLDEATSTVLSEYASVGEGRPEWYDIKYWFKLFGLGDNWMGLLRNLAHEIATYPEVNEVLHLLNGRHRLVVTSNATCDFIEIELGVTGLRECFDAVFSSTSDFGKVKKTPEVYQGICKILDVDPVAMVHVGDHEVFDCAVPKQLGITSYYLDREARTTGDHVVHDLRDFVRRLGLNE
jgi:HAD superfamily hydrolase (TIGR01549 family)